MSAPEELEAELRAKAKGTPWDETPDAVRINPDPLAGRAADTIAALRAERDEAAHDRNEADAAWREERRLRTAVEAREGKLKAALVALEGAATTVRKFGAQTGSHWHNLNSALIVARAALSAGDAK